MQEGVCASTDECCERITWSHLLLGPPLCARDKQHMQSSECSCLIRCALAMYDLLVSVYGEEIRPFLQEALIIQESHREAEDHTRCMWLRSFVLLVCGLENTDAAAAAVSNVFTTDTDLVSIRAVRAALRTTLPPFLQGVCQQRDRFVRETIHIACMWSYDAEFAEKRNYERQRDES